MISIADRDVPPAACMLATGHVLYPIPWNPIYRFHVMHVRGTGLDAYDRSSGQHVLWSTTMPAEAARLAEPLALRCAAGIEP